jgi:hypothetical protein
LGGDRKHTVIFFSLIIELASAPISGKSHSTEEINQVSRTGASLWSVKGLASPQLLAHNEAVIFTDHLFQEAYWGGGGKLKRGGDEGSKGAV